MEDQNIKNEILRGKADEFEKAANKMGNLYRDVEELIVSSKKADSIQEDIEWNLEQRINYYDRAQETNT